MDNAPTGNTIHIERDSKSPTLIDASEQCFVIAAAMRDMPCHESLAAHLLWNSIRLILCHDCLVYLAGTPDRDAELHEISMHLYRHTGDDEYAIIAKNLLPFDGLGRILVDAKMGRIKPHSDDQVNDLIEIRHRLVSIKR